MNDTQPGLVDRLRYRFDNWMSKGTGVLILLLAIVTFFFVVILGTLTWAVVHAVGDEENFESDELGPVDFIWRSLMRTIAAEEGDVGWPVRLLMLVVSIGGMLIGATLIGIISGAFAARVEELRKGRSRVLETDHTLILGWSTKVYSIVREIAEANRSQRGGAIVILADGDKVEMEDAIRAHVGSTGKTRIIVRSGDPMSLPDLAVASAQTARSIIVLAPEESDDPDAAVIKTTLAVTNNPDRKEGKYHIVGELQNPANVEAARLVGRDEAHWVLATEVISRMTVQTCRQSGLSVVYTELLDFEGCEIYFTEQPSLVGQTYFDAQAAFATSTVLGLVQGEQVTLNPPHTTKIAAGDQIIVIAEDDDAIELAPPGDAVTKHLSKTRLESPRPERTLVLGYNQGLELMLKELDLYATGRSRVTVVAQVEAPIFDGLVNLDVTFHDGDPTSRAVLDSLRVTDYDHVIVLAEKDTLTAQRADAKTLITLLHLRDIADQKGKTINVVSEMVDDRNRELAEVTQADDFIVSDRLISLMLSQLSESERLKEVFDILFTPDGAEIYLRPASLYVKEGAEVNFYTVLQAARLRGETAIGYRIHEHARSGAHSYGVVVNPDKTQTRTFGPNDKIIVLAEG